MPSGVSAGLKGMLALERVGKTYPNGVQALVQFSAEIRQGEIVAIIGGSGCGKSTLLRAIAGLDRATTGAVTLDNETISAPHAKIGTIFQEPRLLPWLSVADNIGFGLADLPAEARRRRSRVRSMPSPAATCRIICSTSGPTPGRRWCWSRMMSMRPWCWLIACL